MRILTRYILREVTSHALIGAAIFTFVLFTRDLGRILELVVRASAPLPSVAEIFLYTVPLALTYTIPMSVLVGILIGLSRLAADSEITAMRASGMGVWDFGRALAIFVFAAWLLALGNGLYLAPWSMASLGHLEEQLKGSQVSFEVQPRVFYEGFPKIVLYVQDVHTAQGAAVWKGVFLADISDAANPRITLAHEGILVPEGQDRLHLHLVDGSTHETDPKQADHYQISTFDQTDIPIDLPSTENKAEEQIPVGLVSTWSLRDYAKHVDPISARWYLIEFHRRFALPTACLVLAMVGIPLGLSSKKSGKSGGFVLTIVLVFLYYFVSLIGVSLARQGTLPPALGAWLANIVFFAAALFLLWQAERRPFALSAVKLGWKRPELQPNGAIRTFGFGRKDSANAFERASTRRRVFSASFPDAPRRLRAARFLRLPGNDSFRIPRPVAGLHLVRVAGRYSAQSDAGDCGRRVSAQRCSLPAVQRCAPDHDAGRADHVRTHEPRQRNHRHQSDRNQHLPNRHTRADRRCGARRRLILCRSVLLATHQPAPGGAAQPDQGQAAANLSAS